MNEIQNASLAIQNDIADVKISIQQNNDKIFTIQKKTSEKNFASLEQIVRSRHDFFHQLREILAFFAKIYQNRSVYLEQLKCSHPKLS